MLSSSARCFFITCVVIASYYVTVRLLCLYLANPARYRTNNSPNESRRTTTVLFREGQGPGRRRPFVESASALWLLRLISAYHEQRPSPCNSCGPPSAPFPRPRMTGAARKKSRFTKQGLAVDEAVLTGACWQPGHAWDRGRSQSYFLLHDKRTEQSTS
jgi:hypothetical protein